MERLTIRNDEGIGVLKHPYQCERCGDLQWSLPDLGNGSPTDRLAEYEDIGLTPEQIREIDRLYAGKCKELAELEKSSFSGIEMVKIWAAMKKLKDYEDLEKQGKLLKLPCAVGDTVYTNCSMQGWHFREENRPYEARVVFVGFNGSDNYINVEFDNARMHCMLQFRFSDIGKNVFLTRKEAEAALKELTR